MNRQQNERKKKPQSAAFQFAPGLLCSPGGRAHRGLRERFVHVLLWLGTLALLLLLLDWTGAMHSGTTADDADRALEIHAYEYALEGSDARAGVFVRPCMITHGIEEHAHPVPVFLLCRGCLRAGGDERRGERRAHVDETDTLESRVRVGKRVRERKRSAEGKAGQGLLLGLVHGRHRGGTRGGVGGSGRRRIGGRGRGELGVSLVAGLFGVDGCASATSSERQVDGSSGMGVFRDVWRWSAAWWQTGSRRLTANTDLLCVVVGLVADGGLTALSLELSTISGRDLGNVGSHLSAGHLPHALRVLLDVLLAATARMARADELGVVLETRGDGLAAVGVALDELDHLRLLLVHAPFLEGSETGEDERVPVVAVP